MVLCRLFAGGPEVQVREGHLLGETLAWVLGGTARGSLCGMAGDPIAFVIVARTRVLSWMLGWAF